MCSDFGRAAVPTYFSPNGRPLIGSLIGMGFFDSCVSFFANMEKILVLVSKRNREDNEKRLVKMEKYLNMTGQY